jgi:hypothetical protein
MNEGILLFALGTAMGLLYWALGLAASLHMSNKELSSSDRFLSTAMLWSISTASYEEPGRKLCRWGNIVLVIAIASWLAWAKFR